MATSTLEPRVHEDKKNKNINLPIRVFVSLINRSFTEFIENKYFCDFRLNAMIVTVFDQILYLIRCYALLAVLFPKFP